MSFRNEDSKRFAELITALAATFRQEADHPTFAGYEMALDDLPLAAIEVAIRRAIRECKFMPSGRELRDLAGVQTGDIKPDDRSLIAYSAAARAVATHGMYRTVEFADALTNAAIRELGGWVKFCEWESDQVQWRKVNFQKSYQAFLACGVSADRCAPLPGICDIANGGMGYAAQPVQRIEVDLPPPRIGTVKGEPPKRIESAPDTTVIKRLAVSLRSADEPESVKAPAPREEVSQEEWDRRRELAINRTRAFAENYRAPVETDGSEFVANEGASVDRLAQAVS